MSKRSLIVAACAVLFVLYPLLFAGDGAWIRPSNYALNLGTIILLTAFIGQSWNLAGGFAGLTSFGHALFFGTGAYCSTILQTRYGINPWIGWLASIGSGALIGGVLGFFAFRAGLRGSYFALVTLAMAEMFRILANSVEITRGGLGILIELDRRPANMQFADPIWFYYLALAMVAVSIAVAIWLRRARFGARLAAIRENEDAARALGVDVVREKIKVLALSGAMCAAGGTFYAQKYLYIDPWIAYGVDKSVEMLLVSMIGGAGTVYGPLIGSTVLLTLAEVTRALSDAPGLSLIIYGALLIVIVGFLPEGLVRLFRRRKRVAHAGG